MPYRSVSYRINESNAPPCCQPPARTQVLVVAFGVLACARGICFSVLNNRMTMRLRGMLFASIIHRETG